VVQLAIVQLHSEVLPVPFSFSSSPLFLLSSSLLCWLNVNGNGEGERGLVVVMCVRDV
jgi:hypothetical protein